MNRMIKRTLSAGICLLLLVSACQQSDDPHDSSGVIGDGQESTAAVAMGRYVEQKLDLPTTGEIVTFQGTAPDTFYIWEKIEGSDPEAADTQVIWRSEDGGKSWQAQTPGWLDQLTDFSVSDAAFTAEGDAYLYYSTGSWQTDDHAYHIALCSGNAITPIEGVLEDPESGLRGVRVASTGDLLAAVWGDGLQQWNPENAHLIHFYDNIRAGVGSGYSDGNYITFDSTLATVNDENGTIDLYDLKTGELERSLPNAPGHDIYDRVLAVDPDKSALFYAGNDGLYRVTMDGAITEQLIDGRMAAFGSPVTGVDQIYTLSDNCFLFFCQTDANTYELQKYYFDSSVPTQPAQELTVYSLRDSMHIRVTANAFMQNHPDTLVEYRMGMEADSAISLDDTLRSLNTEILAGTGPDILVLDGLPMDSFIRQGVLLDLTDMIAPLAANGTLLPNIVSAYEVDGKIYGVPNKFTVPFIAGNALDTPDLSALIEYLSVEQPPAIPCYSADRLVEYFYPMCATRWIDEQGQLQVQPFTEDLAAIKAYADRMPVDEQDRVPPFNYFLGQAAWFDGSQSPFMLGKLGSMEEASYIYSALRSSDHPTVQIFPSTEKAHFIAYDVLAINAGSEMTKAAEEFIQIALSDRIQQIVIGRFPVNTAALSTLARAKEPDDPFLRNRVNFLDDTTHSFEVQWLSTDAEQDLMGLIRTLQTPAPQNDVLLQLFVEETAAYLRGEADLSDTTETLAAKIQRYTNEQVG